MTPKARVVDPGALNLHLLVERTVAPTCMVPLNTPAETVKLGAINVEANTMATPFFLINMRLEFSNDSKFSMVVLAQRIQL